MNTCRSVLLLPLAIALLLTLQVDWSNAKKGDKSVMDDIKLSYDNVTWVCDQIVCPPGTHGCRIEIYSDKNDTDRIYNLNACYEIENNKQIVTDSWRWTHYIPSPNILSFYINSYIGAETVCINGAGIVGAVTEQHFNGTVNVTDWPQLQESQRKIVEDIGEPIPT